MAVLNYEGLSYLYSQLIAHFANQNDVKLLSDEVGQLEANLEKTFNTVKVGETSITGSSTTPLTLKGDNIILTPNADNKTITFSISDKTIQDALEDFNFGIATESEAGLIKSGGDISIDANGIVSVKDNSHNHTIENVSGLSTKFTEITQHFDEVEGDIETINTTLATKQDQTQVQNLIDSAINQLVDGAPEALNTLNELAAALGDDKDYYKTINELINGIKNTLNTKANADELGAHVANKENPHEVTIVEEGEGNIVSSFENGAQIVAHKDAYGFSKKEGNVVQENCLEDMPIQIKTILRPTQEGSGNPYPAGCGKNLLPYPYKNTTITTNGITFTDNGDGTITINGTSTGAAYFNFYTAGHDFGDDNMTIPANATNGAYTFSILDAGLGGLNLRYDGTNKKCFISINSGYTFSNLTIYPMIEKGSVKTDWEPYSNIRPISGRTGAKLTRAGKNLFPDKMTDREVNGVTFKVNADKSITTSGTASDLVVVYIETKRLLAGDYILSGCPPKGGSHQLRVLAVDIPGRPHFDDNGEGNRFTLTQDSDVQYSIIIRAGHNVDGLTFYPMLRLASVADAAYEPYQGETFAIDFGQTIYGGVLDWSRGTIECNYRYIELTGDETWTLLGSGNSLYYRMSLGAENNLTTEQLCSHAAHRTSILSSNTEKGFYAYYSSDGSEVRLSIRLGAEAGTDLTSWKNYLAEQKTAGTPVQICYKLTTPYTIQLSPTQIQSLKGINTIYSADGTSSVIFNSELLNYNTTPISVEQIGNFITNENGIDGYGFKATSTIEPQQSGSGKPYPAGGGRNLLDGSKFTSRTTNGATFTANSDGSISISGTATNIANTFADITNTLTAGTYVISHTSTISAAAYCQVVSADGTSKNYWDGQPFTLTGTETRITAYIQINAGTYNGKAYVQIEKGTTATAYQPYSNIRPITGHTGAKLTRCGKNLIPFTNTAQTISGVTFTPQSDGRIHIKGTATASVVYPLFGGWQQRSGIVIPAGVLFSPTVSISGVFALLYYYDSSGKYASVTTQQTLAEQAPNASIFLQINSGTTVDGYFTPMLTVDGWSTAYEPYQGKTFSDSFGQTVYGGELDWNTGVLTSNRKIMTLTGNESWQYYENYDFLYLNGIESAFEEWAKDIVCSHYKASVKESMSEPHVTIVNSGVYNNQLRFYHTGYISVNDWKAFLASQHSAGTPIQIVYRAEKATTIQLTPQHLTMLQGENNFYSNSSSLKVKSNTSIENYYTLDSFNLPTPEKIFTKESVIPIANGGTGSNSRTGAWNNIVAAGGSISGNLTVSGTISASQFSGLASEASKLQIYTPSTATQAKNPGLHIISASEAAVGNTADFNVDTPNTYSTSAKYGTILRLKYNNANAYYTDIYTDTNANALLYKTVSNGTSKGWLRILDSSGSGNVMKPAANGNLTASDFSGAWLRDEGFGQNMIGRGNADGCETGAAGTGKANIFIKSWYGVGFVDMHNGNGVTVAINCRSGNVKAGSFTGSGVNLTSLNASNISSGTLAKERLATSGVTAGTYGPSAAVTGSEGATINVPQITVDAYGRVTSVVNRTYTSKNTTYSTATSSTLGLVKIGYTQSGKNYPVQLSDGKMYVNVPWTDNNTTYSNMTAATSSAAGKAGLVPAPAAGKQNSFLRGDGTWVVPNNTTYTFATGDSNGQIKVTPSGGSAQNISVKGLGTAAYKNASGSWGISITGNAATATTLSSTLSIEKGGTGKTTAAEARVALGITSSTTQTVYHTGNIVASSTEPTNPTEGMIWLKI